ncbi:hypothetical protein PLICRDRAFT_41098 [Plicaturopsis crispa FD-325 SS-3]|nr:hypothetical protein PLICRDRAFT_41098 [Plicaturopsis crispa FD-325 SS-3]
MEIGSQSRDCWLPGVTQAGQIYYVNTQTGEHTREWPHETEGDDTDDDSGWFSATKSRSRSGTSAGFGFVSAWGSAENSSMLSGRTDSPEPWRVEDNEIPYEDAPAEASSYRSGRESSVRQLPSLPVSREATRSPDTSSIESQRRPQQENVSADVSSSSFPNDVKKAPSHAPSPAELALMLQHVMAPSPPDLIIDLADTAQEAIDDLVGHWRRSESQGLPEDDDAIDAYVRNVTDTVRNLLYVSTVPFGLTPKIPGVLHDRPTDTVLQDAAHRVTAILSKFVVPVRTLRHHAAASSTENLDILKANADELQSALSSFVLELQRKEALVQQLVGESSTKRLYGVFPSAHIGLGMTGAGVAGSWRGFGWVKSPDDEEAPSKIFGGEFLTLLSTSLSTAVANIDSLLEAFNAVTSSSDRICFEARATASSLSHFLTLVSDTDFADQIDIDGSSGPSHPQYTDSVTAAKTQVRALEMYVQALYDDASELLLAAQAASRWDPGQPVEPKITACADIGSIATALKANVGTVRQVLSALLTIGKRQAELAPGDDHRTIAESLSSRLSIVDGNLGLPQSPPLPPLPAPSPAFTTAFASGFAEGSSAGPPSLSLYPPQEPSRFTEAFSPDTARLTTPILTAGINDEWRRSVASPISPDLQSPLFDDEPKIPIKPRRGEKLRQILGDEAPQTYINKHVSDMRPWYLRRNCSPEEILEEPDGVVRGGTLEALVEKLTPHEPGDPNFNNVFLTTFKSFMTLDELFNLLVARFRISPPDNLKPKELEEWRKLKQHIVQIRVLNTLKSMVSDDDILEKEDFYIYERMKEFASSPEVADWPAAKQLLTWIERAQTTGAGKIRTLVNTSTHLPPLPIVPKNPRNMELTDIDPAELARQLTLMESQLYQKIRPLEWLQRAREQATGANSGNIAQFTQTFDRMANWVTDCILSKSTVRGRAAVVKYFIGVADLCRSIHNFSTMVAISSGLTSTPIRRLQKTWELVSVRYTMQLSACEVITDPHRNFSNYHSTLAKTSPPCVPFIGVFLTSLTFIQDGNKDNIQPNIVNFRKRRKAAEVIQEIKRWQSIPFNFHPIPSVLKYIEESLKQYDQPGLADRFWTLSHEREPREKDEEKMTRLLHESGFL